MLSLKCVSLDISKIRNEWFSPSKRPFLTRNPRKKARAADLQNQFRNIISIERGCLQHRGMNPAKSYDFENVKISNFSKTRIFPLSIQDSLVLLKTH